MENQEKRTEDCNQDLAAIYRKCIIACIDEIKSEKNLRRIRNFVQYIWRRRTSNECRHCKGY